MTVSCSGCQGFSEVFTPRSRLRPSSSLSLSLPVGSGPLPFAGSLARLSRTGIRTGVASGKNLARRLTKSNSRARAVALAWLGTIQPRLEPLSNSQSSREFPSPSFGGPTARLGSALSQGNGARRSPNSGRSWPNEQVPHSNGVIAQLPALKIGFGEFDEEPCLTVKQTVEIVSIRKLRLELRRYCKVVELVVSARAAML
jgi:hypothetical protein